MCTKDPCEWRALPRSPSTPPVVRPALSRVPFASAEDERATVCLLRERKVRGKRSLFAPKMAVKPKRRRRSGRPGPVGGIPRCNRRFPVRAPHTDAGKNGQKTARRSKAPQPIRSAPKSWEGTPLKNLQQRRPRFVQKEILFTPSHSSLYRPRAPPPRAPRPAPHQLPMRDSHRVTAPAAALLLVLSISTEFRVHADAAAAMEPALNLGMDGVRAMLARSMRRLAPRRKKGLG